MNKVKALEGRAENLIQELIKEVTEAQSMPLSQGKAVINREEFIEKLESLSSMVNVEMNTYREINDKRARIINDAEKEAENIVYEAEKNASRIRVTKRAPWETSSFRVAELNDDEKAALIKNSEMPKSNADQSLKSLSLITLFSAS